MRNFNHYLILKLLLIAFLLAFLFTCQLEALNNLLKLKLDSPTNAVSIEATLLAEFNSRKNQINSIILGDSHPGQAFDLEGLPKNFFRATQAGEDYNLTLLKANYFIDHSTKIKTIYLPLDYHSLNDTFGVPRNEYLIFSHKPIERTWSRIYSHNKLFDDYTRKLTAHWVFSKFNQKYIFKNMTLGEKITGFEVINPKDTKFASLVETRVKGMLHPPIIDKRSINSLDLLISHAREHGVKVIGIRYPLPRIFHRKVRKHKLNLMSSWINNNKEKFDRIYDYRYIYDRKQEYFGNEDHLNIPGAKHFTKLFLHSNDK